MKRENPEVLAARIEADRSRARLMATAHELQDRLSPKTVARDAWEGAKIKGADLAEDAVDAVRARPMAAGGAAAGLVLFLARHPIINLGGKLIDAVTGRPARKKGRQPKDKQEKTETVE